MDCKSIVESIGVDIEYREDIIDLVECIDSLLSLLEDRTCSKEATRLNRHIGKMMYQVYSLNADIGFKLDEILIIY